MDHSENTDLPEKFGPMTVKELRQSLRRSSFVYPFTLIHIFATVAIYAEFQLPDTSNAKFPAVFVWDVESVGIFWWVAMGVCGFLMPMAGFTLMQQEVEEGNHELLLLTSLSRWKIVFGKFLMLWGLSVLTFASLIPYVVIRYFLGGIEWAYELANAGTVILVAACLSTGTLAASGFRNIGARIGVFFLFLGASVVGGSAGMAGGIMSINLSRSSSYSELAMVFYHFCAFSTVASFCFLGLMIARSRLRVATMSFELKPSSLLLVILGLSPFIVGFIALFSCGYGSVLGVYLLAFMAWQSDVTPRAPKWMKPPAANIPPPLPPSAGE